MRINNGPSPEIVLSPEQVRAFTARIQNRAVVRGSKSARFEMQADAPGVATIYLYDEIGASFWGGGISASDFVQALRALDDSVNELQVHINSPGGDVFDGVAILNALRQHPANVVVTIDGLAASAASLVAMAGSEVRMAPQAEMMIHDASGICMGQAVDMQKMADVLGRISDNIASAYAAKAGGDVADWRAAMLAETWYSDQEAVDAGLADSILPLENGGDTAAKARAAFDLSFFNYAGRANAPAPGLPAADTAPQATARGERTTAERGDAVEFTEDQLTTMRTTLGLPADADQAAIMAAIGATATPPVVPPAPALPAGVVAVDQATLDALRADAAQGRTAREQQLTDARDAAIEAAIEDGRITPARRGHWQTAWDADSEGAAAALASLSPGLVPVESKGHGAGLGAAEADDAEYYRITGETPRKSGAAA